MSDAVYANAGQPVTPDVSNDKKPLFGLDAGLKLSAEVWKGISVFLTPTLYYVGGTSTMPGGNTIGGGKMHLYETLNIGVQYKIGRLRRSPEVLRSRRMQRDSEWKARQEQKEREREAERKARIEKRRSDR